MSFTLHVLRGVDDIEFGMTAEMVGQRMEGPLEIGNIRATSPEHPTYSYPDVPVFFYFDEDGHLEGIEFCRGADVTIAGVNILNLSVRQALAFMKRLDPDTVIDNDGAASHKFSLEIWCPHIGDEEDKEPVETVLISKPGMNPLPVGGSA